MLLLFHANYIEVVSEIGGGGEGVREGSCHFYFFVFGGVFLCPFGYFLRRLFFWWLGEFFYGGGRVGFVAFVGKYLEVLFRKGWRGFGGGGVVTFGLVLRGGGRCRRGEGLVLQIESICPSKEECRISGRTMRSFFSSIFIEIPFLMYILH